MIGGVVAFVGTLMSVGPWRFAKLAGRVNFLQ